MAGFGEASCMLKSSFIVTIFGLVVHLIGFGSDYWQFVDGVSVSTAGFSLSIGSFHSGLWSVCSAGNCATNPNNSSWFEATQAFETLGFIAALAALVLLVLYIFVPATSGKKIVFILSMLACFAAAGCIILGIIIYGSKVKDNLSWSFALCTIAGIIFGVSGILLIVDMLKR